MLLWLWLWLWLAATAPIRPLAWEPPYAVGAALEKAKSQKKKKKKKEKKKMMASGTCPILFQVAAHVFTSHQLAFTEKHQGELALNC